MNLFSIREHLRLDLAAIYNKARSDFNKFNKTFRKDELMFDLYKKSVSRKDQQRICTTKAANYHL